MQLFSAFVADALSRPAASDSHRYLVVDAAATRPTDMGRLVPFRGVAADILTGERCNWQDSAGPVLIELPSEHAAAAVCRYALESLERWRYANCFLYFESRHEQQYVARALRARTDALLPQNMPVLLRYFDSRVFDVLLNTLTEPQRNEFLSLGRHWAAPDRLGELRSIEQGDEAGRDLFSPPLTLDTAQEAALIEAGEADAMIDLLLNQNNASLLTMLPPDQHTFIGAALAATTTLRIDRLADQTAYCETALALGAGFHDRAPWVRWLPEVSAGRLRFADLLSRMAESEDA